MKQTTLSRLSGQYLAALQSYIEQGPQAGFEAAHGLGNEAVTLELGTLELAKMHDEALAALVPAGGAADSQEEVTARAAAFFAEVQRPVEKTPRLARAADRCLKPGTAQSATLLAEAGQLQEHLQALTRQILTAEEEERMTMSLTLQDEIAQTLLGIHVRLLALQREVSASAEDFQNEIAATQRLVLESVTTINRYAGKLNLANER